MSAKALTDEQPPSTRAEGSGSHEESNESVPTLEGSWACGGTSSANHDATTLPPRSQVPHLTTRWISCLILLTGAAACATILGLGITAIQQDHEADFLRVATDLQIQFEIAFRDYATAGKWLHQACRERRMTHRRFREVYEYMASGLEFQFVAWNPNVTHAERPLYENETRVFRDEMDLPGFYLGFSGVDYNSSTRIYTPQPRSPQPFYFPIHFIEPIESEYQTLDFDSYAVYFSESIDRAIQTWAPVLSPRIRYELRAPPDQDPEGTYHVSLHHPGVPLPSFPEVTPRDLAIISFYVPDLFERAHGSTTTAAAAAQGKAATRHPSTSVYLFDATDSPEAPQFLGGAHVDQTELAVAQEIELSELRAQRQTFEVENSLQVASREWLFVVTCSDTLLAAGHGFVILGAALIFLASAGLALWVDTHHRRAVRIHDLQAQAEAEKTALMVENAKKAAASERELNDYLSHECRNPLAAAMSATYMVELAVNDPSMRSSDVTKQQQLHADVKVIDNSLKFVNDLLRNMLDVHRTASKELTIAWAPVDLMRDVFEPVQSMLYNHEDGCEVLIDCCPASLIVQSDRLRLKQVVLNLSRNAIKFVTKGFVRLRASVVEGNVALYIEDSGPGVPEEKRSALFKKFQSSLDSLNQGTGIGLCLSKNLVDLMGAELYLDDAYNSGIEEFPGARFVVNLNRPPVDVADLPQNSAEDTHKVANGNGIAFDLPTELSVLFVDDDMVVRKLFVRSVQRICPDWGVQEAANGETCLRLCQEQRFDLIFLDQYMASVDRQLLGTETVRTLRVRGIDTKVCGLSANDLEQAFLKAGADAFLMKPFPCQHNALKAELVRIMHANERVIP